MSSDEKGSQRPIRQSAVPPGPLADLKALVYELYAEAGFPTLDQIPKWADLAKRAAAGDPAAARAWQATLDDMPARDGVRRIIGGASLPPSQRSLVAMVRVLANASGRDLQYTVKQALDLWDAARKDAARIPSGAVRAADADLQQLGVHAAIKVAGVRDNAQPEYVLRDTDLDESGVRGKLAVAAEGAGGFVLLLGGSSVGKTRCAAEAVAAVLPDWHLVQPGCQQDVTALGAAPSPRTVVWLDELQLYLGGERGLSDADILVLLNGPHPVVIIATLWPDYYTQYTTPPERGKPDTYGRERRVLGLADVVRIDPEFNVAERSRAYAAAEHDLQLQAALGTGGYGLTQTLAAAPQLVERWQDARTAAPYAWAVLTAALDAARLGTLAPLSADFLRDAAPGYCTSTQQAEAPENWFEQAMTYATRTLHGAASALLPAGAGMGNIVGYTAAGYLIQHANRTREAVRVPDSTWKAVLDHVTDPLDRARAALAAENQNLEYALREYRRAAYAGDGFAAEHLARLIFDSSQMDDRQKENELRDLAADGVVCAAIYLWMHFGRHCDFDKADQALRTAVWQLEALGERAGWGARAGTGDWDAVQRAADLLAVAGEVDQLRDLAGDADIWLRAIRATECLLELGRIGELRTQDGNGGSIYAAHKLNQLLARTGKVDELRHRAAEGDPDADWRFREMLLKAGMRNPLHAMAIWQSGYSLDLLQLARNLTLNRIVPPDGPLSVVPGTNGLAEADRDAAAGASSES